MVGECNTLIGARGIWGSLVKDAKQRKRTEHVKIDKLFKAAKAFAKIDNGQCITYVPSKKFTQLVSLNIDTRQCPLILDILFACFKLK